MDSGSGVIVSPDGLVLTASTLLQGNRPIKITFASGNSVYAKVIATDNGTESALLRIHGAYEALPLADSSAVKVGFRAITAGNPLDALSSDHQVAISAGTITGIYDTRSADAASRYAGPVLETDAAINAGSEGGALINEEGQMIGMTCLCVDRARMRGCAVPLNRIREAYSRFLPAVASAHLEDAAVGEPVRSAIKRNLTFVSFERSGSIRPGMPLHIVTKSSSSSPCICNCIVSATGRCDGAAVQIDARLNESDVGALVLNRDGDIVGTVSHMNTTRQCKAQNAGVSFFTPVEKLPRQASEDPLADLITASSRAFVFIGDGSGVVVSEDGLVLTNYHVAGSRNTWTVRLGGEDQSRLCDVVSSDAKRDLCLLKIRGISNAPFIKLGSSSALKAGDQVVALGDPFKLGEKNGDPAASSGIISAVHRNQGRYVDAIQTDCAINPGCSGGPLINIAGELVGLNGQIISRYGKNNTGVAFAIPVDQIKDAMPNLKGARASNKAPTNPRRCACAN